MDLPGGRALAALCRPDLAFQLHQVQLREDVASVPCARWPHLDARKRWDGYHLRSTTVTVFLYLLTLRFSGVYSSFRNIRYP